MRIDHIKADHALTIEGSSPDPLGQGADIQSAWQVSKIPSYVPLTERVKAALLTRKKWVNEGRVFPSKRSGYITDREVSKQWLEAKRIAGIPENVVLCWARHRFSTDAMEGTGNVIAVMDTMGHGSVNTTRIYTHTNAALIREAIERRNRLSAASEQQLEKMATKMATSELAVAKNRLSDWKKVGSATGNRTRVWRLRIFRPNP
jgi:hypothetical protein